MIRFTALLLTVLTGFTALVYEVAWQKYLATLLGSHAEATAAVLAIFLGGLSVGYAAFGRLTRRLALGAGAGGRPPQLLRVYGAIEAGIGLYALSFPTLFGIAQSISLLVPFHAGFAFGFDVLLTLLLIGPPTVLMGSTIPFLTLALAGDLEHATRVHAWVYGFNTLGAFAGALAGGFFLVPMLGLDGVVYAMGGINLLAGAAFLALAPFGAPLAARAAGGAQAAGAPLRHFAGYAAVALLSGYAMMAVQTTLNRIGGLAFGASHFTFAMVVAVFVLCIACGSLAVSLLSRISPLVIAASQWLLVLLLAVLYLELPNATYYAHVLRMLFRNEEFAFYPFYLSALAAVLAVLLIPIGLSGALLPLLFHHLRRELGSLGSVAGRLYSWNTVGSLLGALLGGYLLLFWIELQHVYATALAALILGASLLTVLLLRVSPLAIAGLVVLPALFGVVTLPQWNPDRLAAGLFRTRNPGARSFAGPDKFFGGRRSAQIVFHTDDPTSTVTVRENRGRGTTSLSLFTNGKSDGNQVSDYVTMGLSALIPALFAERNERCFVIGFGLGVTTGELATLSSTREIHVAEIAQGVVDAAPLFDGGNLAASRSPKVQIHRSDAYRALLRSEGVWDVIASEPSNPWVTGVEMLYSVEFLEAVRERLAPGGVFAQWFHLYELDDETARIVLRNYAAAFSHVSVWFTMSNDVLLVAFDRPDSAFALARLEERFARSDFTAGFARSGVESFTALLAHELLPLGVLQAADLPGELHTLRHPILSHHAARAFFQGQLTQIPKFVGPVAARVGVQNSLLRRYAARDGRLSEDVLAIATRETCRLQRDVECGTFFARWRFDHPDSPRLEEALVRARLLLATVRPPPGDDAPEFEAQLIDARITELTALYGAPMPPSRRPLAHAVGLTNDYVLHYEYAAPFERSVLRRAWQACTAPPCANARRAAERRVGLLEVEPRGRPPGPPGAPR